MEKVIEKKFEDMTSAELHAELKRLKDSLCDLEEMHAFTFGRTSVHIGATKAQSMQEEYEEGCRLHNEQIAKIEGVLKGRGAK